MKSFVISLAIFFSTGAQAKIHMVKMLNTGKDGVMAFEPGFIKASVGDTINFIPTDSSHATNSILTPNKGVTWNGQLNKKVTVTMNKEGVYIYECQPHSLMGMVGVIQVGKPHNLETAKKFAQEYSKKIVLPANKSRLEKYLSKVN